jgi:cobalamin biosynthesis Mg chelatase CobN
MEYADYVATLKELDPGLAQELEGFHSLENILGWMKGRGLPLDTLDLVTQDEYSHDVLIPLGPGRRFLVLGIT